jgi:predicted Zn-dependent protease
MRGIRARLAAAAAGALLLAGGGGAHGQDAAGIPLPDIGAPDSAVVSPREESRVGRELLLELRRRGMLVEDLEVAEYVRALGRRVAGHSDDPSASFTFFAIDQPAINAFAAPGGYVAVNTGLIRATETESELAAVLAHEIAHVTQRHIARRFEAMERMTIPTIAALAAAILVGSQSGEAGAAAIAAAQAGALQMQIDFTRANEKEADRVGMQTLARAGFDPHSMPSFFERLQTATRYYGRPPEFLSTHPVNVARIADSRSRAEDLGYRQVPDSRDYLMVQAKLDALAGDDPQEAVAELERRLEQQSYRDRAAARYGLAIALRRAGEAERAARILEALLEASPERIPFLYELGRTRLARDDIEGALQVYARGLALYPTNRMMVLGRADALLAAGRAPEARELLAARAAGGSTDPRLYWLLGRSEDLAGNPVAARLALAEHYRLIGDLQAAIDQLERARRAQPESFYQSSRIDARLEALRAEAELAAELGGQ